MATNWRLLALPAHRPHAAAILFGPHRRLDGLLPDQLDEIVFEDELVRDDDAARVVHGDEPVGVVASHGDERGVLFLHVPLGVVALGSGNRGDDLVFSVQKGPVAGLGVFIDRDRVHDDGPLLDGDEALTERRRKVLGIERADAAALKVDEFRVRDGNGQVHGLLGFEVAGDFVEALDLAGHIVRVEVLVEHGFPVGLLVEDGGQDEGGPQDDKGKRYRPDAFETKNCLHSRSPTLTLLPDWSAQKKRRELQAHASSEEPASPASKHKTRRRAPEGGASPRVSLRSGYCWFSEEAICALTQKIYVIRSDLRVAFPSTVGNSMVLRPTWHSQNHIGEKCKPFL